jgi:hypothetical protein
MAGDQVCDFIEKRPRREMGEDVQHSLLPALHRTSASATV